MKSSMAWTVLVALLVIVGLAAARSECACTSSQSELVLVRE